jgi:ubiquinol-cytochrome c reductase cytochrome b subunit
MFSAILVILVLPFTDRSKLKGLQFKSLSKYTFWIFLMNFIVLMVLGAKHVENPFIEYGQISTSIYFGFFFLYYFITKGENFLFTIKK